ncbi:hypothetical protein Pan153_10100 [Gimesia panareensis]|uniref:Uncharacterized protein n=1 Tax=Gimesia panareensis TaxID=2527978 RepID=A0A518FJB7_9PLAN|nr:hypothetical protein [Gimesia panareensis]QDV16383.1 hypothetical protein Pan153_10100 [Gimesia panareensis]
MKPFLLFVLTGGVWFAVCERAYAEEEYLLRVNVMGFIDSPEEHPKEKLLRSIEVVTVPGRTFHCKTRLGGHTRSVSGSLNFEEDEIKVEVDYRHTYDDGTRIPPGEPVLDIDQVKTTISVEVGKWSVLGGSETKRESPLPKLRTKKECHVLLTRYEPKEDEVFKVLDSRKPVINP